MFLVVSEIDGEALLLLVNDQQEFTRIITKAVSRLKIKKFMSTQNITPETARMSMVRHNFG